MKLLIILELTLLLLATTFQSDNPWGWYQQTLPVSDQINDIFFLDSLNGWIVTNGSFTGDTGYIMQTIDGGNSWVIQYSNTILMNAVQFTDDMSGYVVGNFYAGTGNNILKTTDGGNNWVELNALSNVSSFTDLNFPNKDTGWICSDDAFKGGVFKTTDGGLSWQQQLNLGLGNPLKIFFVDNDTGWFANEHKELFKTVNGGINWNIVFTSPYNIEYIFFLNAQKGWMRGAATTANSIGISYTSDGGINWFDSQGNTIGGFDLQFINDSIGFGGTYSSSKVMKSVDGGKIWGFQNTPIMSSDLIATLKNDTSKVWAGEIMHTKNGGGNINFTSINNNSSVVINFILYQNYPNPFNPKTTISYQLRALSDVELKVYDILGKEIITLVNQKQNAGDYKTEFDGNALNSGVYFYRLNVKDINSNKILSEIKSMLLIK